METEGMPPESGAQGGGAEGSGPTGDEWSATGPTGETGGRASQMLAQLQAMIDDVAQQAAPVLREVAAKAAELAAVAGQKAGPIAHRAADVTEEVGVKVAQRGKELAADLRRSGDGQTAGASEPSETTAEPITVEPTEPTEPLAESNVEHTNEAVGE